MSLEQARETLRRYWGYKDFRPGQDEAIRNVLGGGDSLTIMPTGGGKSLCYQVPGSLLPGVTLVVSPLISLMKDQVDTLDAIGLPATFINSTLSGGEMAERLEAAERGDVKLLYVAPERFDSESFQRRLARLQISLLAVDESHCVSEWGHDFRPSYLRLGRVREALGNPPIAALTATATPEVRRDIIRQLGLREPAVLVTGFDRRNLHWHVLRAKNDSEKDRLLVKLLRSREGSAIVYASTRKNVDALTNLLSGIGLRTVGYHAGIGDADRKRIQESFMGGTTPVVVATNAFGMGIDKSDVRIVVHYNMPGNLEAYYQEAGRAGRDGGDAECVLLHAYADRFTHEFFMEQSHPPKPAVEEAMRALRTASDGSGMVTIPLAELARTLSSVKGDRQLLSAVRVLEQFGLVRQVQAGQAPTVRLRLIATPERIGRELETAGRTAELNFLRALWRVGGGKALYSSVDIDWRRLGDAAGGRARATQLLEGLGDEGFVEWQAPNGEGVLVLDRSTPVNRLPIDWQALNAKKAAEARKLKQIQGYAYTDDCRRGYVLQYFGDPAAMKECGACDNCLKGAGPVAERVGARDPEAAGAPARSRPTRGSTRAPTPTREADDELRGALRTLRRELARKGGVPPFVIFTDASLEALALHRPRTAEEMLEVPGIGPKTLEKYGQALLEALGGFVGLAPDVLPPPRTVSRRPSRTRPSLDDAGAPTPEQSELYSRLRSLRSDLAREAQVPAYCVFSDRTLIELARRVPLDDGEMLAVPGIGPAKLERYGNAVLDVLRGGGG